MENKVYYGEYSLKHWVDLLLKNNIVLPWYQRSFVWEKEDIERLIKTLDNNEFIPPVIIGAVKENEEWKNYILDGQQRLTTILFIKCNKYIDKNDYASNKPEAMLDTKIADDLIDDKDDEQDIEIKMIEWNFTNIIKNKQINIDELNHSFYKKLFDDEKDNKYFEEHFLGFAYIKPSNNVKEEEQSKFYSNIFRNINTGGKKLTRSESRKALYFLKEDLKDFFLPEYLKNIKVETSSKESGLIDFVKYLSILSQYKGNNSQLYKYGGRDWEKNENYYNAYIVAIVSNDSKNHLKFDISYPDNPYNNDRIVKLKDMISRLNIKNSFSSIIDMDMYFFGLVNEIVFNNREIDDTKGRELMERIDEKTNELKDTDLHKYNPNALKYLRTRITASIEIYNGYLK
jgi:uncharacterized protein with ParB-like and HNH nuclease domain